MTSDGGALGAWSYINQVGLARYVTPEAQQFIRQNFSGNTDLEGAEASA